MVVITFILKKVMEVRRSTVAFKSCSFSGLEAGKLFLYMDKSILRLLCRVSSSLMNRSFCTRGGELLSDPIVAGGLYPLPAEKGRASGVVLITEF